MTERDEDFIDDLKCVVPRIERNIRRVESNEAATFYYSRLKLLADAAHKKSLSLKGDDKPLATSESNAIM
jgi:hypothetical protein